MRNAGGIRRFSAAELKKMRARGESLTDHGRLAAQTDAEVEASDADDPDFSDIPADWHKAAVAIVPMEKKLISLRLDQDVVEGFRSQGPGYQTRINAVLRAYLNHKNRKAGGNPAG